MGLERSDDMPLFNFTREKPEDAELITSSRLFQPGAQFPPPDSIERIAKYKRMKKIFDAKPWEVFARASALLKDTPHASQLQTLYIAVNIIDAIVTKPADLLVGEPPSFETGLPDSSLEQRKVNEIVLENDLVQLIHESVIGGGIRGDSFIKTRYGYRQDFSEVQNVLSPEAYDDFVASQTLEPIIEHVNATYVFPETSRGNVKRFKAINIATVEYVETPKRDVPFLNVERHVPGYIIYERYRLHEFEGGVDNTYGYPVQIYKIGEKVATGREEDVVETGVPHILVKHIPYKAVDDDWRGIGGIEKVEGLLSAINDRITQIDYILWKHADPTAYGPDIDDGSGNLRFGGKYIPLTENDPTPGYMTWDGRLDAAFKELEYLLGLVFQISETPDWLFGTSLIGDGNKVGGTSHTTNAAIKSRFMPILSKVNRIRAHVDKAIREAIYDAQLLELFANRDNREFEPYEPIYPTINWKSGIPKDEKEEAEVMSLRTGGKPTIDVKSAIKRMDDVDDMQAQEVMNRIADDEKNANGFVDGSIFNAEGGAN
jgi:hypothetical protein